MITIHGATEDDFSTLGLGALDPTECEIEEKAGGLYELTLTHPITDDFKSTLIAQGRIIKAPAPARESPRVEISTGTVTRHIYQVAPRGGRVNLRVSPSTNNKAIGSYRSGTEVAVTETSGNWSHVFVLNGGAEGWMWTAYLGYLRDETETIAGDTPGTVIVPTQTREQLFRIVGVENDSKRRRVTASAQHITYDLKGVIVARDYSPENVSAATVLQNAMSYADHETPFSVVCYVTDPVTIDCTGRNILDIIMGSEDGILEQTGARLFRDNYTLYILPAEERDRGVTLRYAKNLLSAVMKTDTSNLLTRIQPAGKTKKGDVLLIDDDVTQTFVDSERINDYPIVYAKRVEYDVVEGKDYTKAQARAKLRELAEADFEAGCDLPDIKLDADFVRLDLTEDYRHLANAYALHLYDTVPVTDDEAGIVATARMTGYKYDAVLDRYSATTLGELTDAEVAVYGYEIGGSVSGTKIIPNTMDGSRLKSLSVNSAKISDLAVTSAKIEDAAITRAKIADAAIGSAQIETASIGTAQIADAAIGTAKIADGSITNAKIGNAAIQTANIGDAAITSAKIGSAAIGSAQIGDAAISTAKIQNGAITTALIGTGAVGTAQVADGSITDAKIVGLTASKITAGTIDAATVNINNLNADNIVAGTINGARIPTLGSDKIADGAISGVKIINGAVTTDKITDGAVTAAKIVASAVTADKIAANAVTVNKIAAGAVTAAKIDVADLFAAQATINALDAHLVKASSIQALKDNLALWAADQIALKVGESGLGSPNLLLKTRRTLDVPGVFTYPEGASSYEYGGEYPEKFTRFTIPGVLGSLDVLFPISGLIVGQTYTFSMDCIAYSPSVVNIGVNGSERTWYDGWSNYVKRISNTFTAASAFLVMSIYVNKGSGADYVDIRKIKLELGSMPTAWCESDEEFRAGSIILDRDGLRLSGGEIEMNAGTAFKVKSGGTVQIDTASGDDSHINLGDGNFSASKDGGVIAGAGHFGTSLDVSGRRVLTLGNDISHRIIVSANDPGGTDLIWIRPSAVSKTSYTAYTAGSRNKTVDFAYTNPIVRTFKSVDHTTLTGSTITYSITVPLFSIGASMDNFELTGTLSKNGQTVQLSSAICQIKPWTETKVTLTAVSGINLCADGIDITVSLSGDRHGGSGNVYLQKDTNMTLTGAVESSSGMLDCTVKYIPVGLKHGEIIATDGTILGDFNGRVFTGHVWGFCCVVTSDNGAYHGAALVSPDASDAPITTSDGLTITYAGQRGDGWYYTRLDYFIPSGTAYTSAYPSLNNITGIASYEDAVAAAGDIIRYYNREI